MIKALFFLCAQALMDKPITGQCFGPRLAAPVAAPLAASLAAPCAAVRSATPLAAPCAYEAAIVPASNGGGLKVASASAIPPREVSVLSENVIEGPLVVTGALPFLGTVAFEGVLPTAGAGAVNYGCGYGAVAIFAEDVTPTGIAGPLSYGMGPLTGPYRAGCGCGALI